MTAPSETELEEFRQKQRINSTKPALKTSIQQNTYIDLPALAAFSAILADHFGPKY